jgi:hypothetical protein
LRRFAVAITAVAVLALAATAYAAINTYTASMTFTSNQSGTAHKPVPIGYTETLKITGTNGNRAGVQSIISTKIYGLVEDGKDFPTCSLTQIANAKNDTVCPKGAEVATGYITAALGSSTNFKTAGGACDPQLDVWNSGQGKLTFFFVDTPTHQCLGTALKTGSTGPYPATYKEVGKYLQFTVKTPDYINYPLPGLAGSLETEKLTYFKKTRTVHGKTVAITSSIACQGKKRPYSATFTSTLPPAGPATETDTVSKNAPC